MKNVISVLEVLQNRPEEVIIDEIKGCLERFWKTY